MEELQKPGAEHTYEYHEYPAVRYAPGGETRTITCKEQEENGWFDSPAKAQAIASKELAKASARAAKDKEAAREARAKEKAALEELAGTDKPDEQNEYPEKLEDYTEDQLLECAVEYEVDSTGLSAEELIVAIKKAAGYKVEDPTPDINPPDEQEAEAAPAAEEANQEWPSKSKVSRMNRAALEELAGKLGLLYPDETTNKGIVALINDKLGR